MQENDIREILSCVGCCHIVVPPVKMCLIGHLCCNHCYIKNKSCPLCESVKGQVRNFLVEQLLEALKFPCIFKKRGCEVKEDAFGIRKHEITCDYRLVECFLQEECECEWQGNYKDAFPHCLQEHPENTYSKNIITVWTPIYQRNKEFMLVVNVYGRIFRISWFVFDNCDSDVEVLCWGLPEDEQKFVSKYQKLQVDDNGITAIVTISCNENQNQETNPEEKPNAE